jgi:16S rRNA (guanine966-N2)-methyltransferase
VRVIAGTARGRRLVAPRGLLVRPTTDRVKAALFSALDARGLLLDASVLDLYAGSGALGIEALSRGAAHAVFVDNAKDATRAIADNVERCALADRATIIARDVPRFVATVETTFDLAFVDPPYNVDRDRLSPVLAAVARVAPGGVIVVERPAGPRAEAVPPPDGWEATWHREFGDTLVEFLTSSADATHRGR